MKTKDIGIIGCGYWGPNYIRVNSEIGRCRDIFCCDLEESRLKALKSAYPHIHTTTNYVDLLKNPDIDSIIIATPTKTHYAIAKACLEHGKNVLVEKPFVTNLKDGEELVRIGRENKKIIMVGHTYLFNPSILKIKEMISDRNFGNILHVSAERVGLGPIRKQGSSLWDLSTHDIAIATYLLGGMPESVSCIGGKLIQKDVEDVVSVTMKYKDGTFYNIYASWFSPEKIRKTTIVGDNGMCIFDDVKKEEPLKIFEYSIDRNFLGSSPDYEDHQKITKKGEIKILNIDNTEPMKIMMNHFFDSIENNSEPRSDGEFALKIIAILEAAELSMRNDGKAVRL